MVPVRVRYRVSFWGASPGSPIPIQHALHGRSRSLSPKHPKRVSHADCFGVKQKPVRFRAGEECSAPLLEGKPACLLVMTCCCG